MLTEIVGRHFTVVEGVRGSESVPEVVTDRDTQGIREQRLTPESRVLWLRTVLVTNSPET